MPPPAPTASVELLVVQPTPFCNLDCDYCYLPQRTDRARMTAATLELMAERIVSAGWLAPQATVVWHAGEPLVVEPGWYAAARARLAAALPPEVRLTYSFQTNGTLLDEGWLDLLRQPDVRIGVSLDGPQDLHDAHRRQRNGKGSFAATMRGIDLLQRSGVPFHVIAVLTRPSLDEPDRLFDFFRAAGINRIAFNIEEIEGVNRASSLANGDARPAYITFLRRWLERMADCADPPWVRELDRATSLIMRGDDRPPPNQQAEPLRILSVDVHGRLSTFSPELLGMPHPGHGGFLFADLRQGGPERLLENAAFRGVRSAIEKGRHACARSCAFYRWCGGGAPANKLFETGTFESTETLYCRLVEQAPLLAVLQSLEAGAACKSPERVR